MKKLIYISIIILLCKTTYSQTNLVPNGSFEQYSICPNSTGQTSYTNNWFWAGASTDYYNSCSPQGNMSVPENVYGYQNSPDGNAYIGMNLFAYYESLSQFYIREPISTLLNTPLQIGTKYFVSFKVSLTLNDFESCCAVNKIGVRFTTSSYTDANGNNPAPINNFAHVYTNDVITDTVNWTTIKGSFIADSVYNYVTLGNFFDSTHITLVDFRNNYPQTSASYYYFDDVKISTDSSYVNGISFYDESESITIYPNPAYESLTIKVNNSNQYYIALKDVMGKTIFSRQISELYKIDLSYISSGLFFLELTNRTERIMKKIIINK